MVFQTESLPIVSHVQTDPNGSMMWQHPTAAVTRDLASHIDINTDTLDTNNTPSL